MGQRTEHRFTLGPFPHQPCAGFAGRAKATASALMNLIQRLLDLPIAVKFILGLLVTSLLSTAVSAGFAYFLMASLFNDLAMAQALRDSLLAGEVIAMLLALALGLILGTQLSQRLKRLTRAIRAMEHGELRQHVIMGANDEIGQLAREFNQLSRTLAAREQELRDSREQIQRQAERLHTLSMADALTGLYNRRYFDEQGELLFERAVRYNRPLSVILGDIDHFKNVNDTYSHAMGDEVLRRIGELLSAKARATDLVARYGGEEFVIAFPETTLAQATATCELLRQRIESYAWDTLHADLRITISIGVCADTHLKNMGEMVSAADKLLYKAKQAGRNRVCSE